VIPPITYIDRRSGAMKAETVYAAGFLRWAYNTASGAAAGRLLFGSRLVSRLYGRWNSTSVSRRRIPGFIRRMGIDMSECPLRPEEFPDFNAFFRRPIDPGARPVAGDPDICVSPADGKARAYPRLGMREQIRVKCHALSVEELLDSRPLAESFDGGPVVIIRLGLADYHHVHFPDDGVPGRATPVGGGYHAGGPYAQTGIVPFYSKNYRMRSIFRSSGFGPIAMVEVGAFTVGSIVQTFTEDRPVRRGERKSFFELGGSTVVMVFRPGMFTPDADLVRNTSMGLETSVRLGEPIGRRMS